MKIVKKYIRVLFVVTICLISVMNFNSNKSYASDLSIDNIFKKGNSFINKGSASADSTLSIEKAEEEFLPVGKILVIIANAVVIICVAVMGIKWITASPDKQGKLKQQLIGLVVSIIVIYGAVGIWTLLKNTLFNLEKEQTSQQIMQLISEGGIKYVYTLHT